MTPDFYIRILLAGLIIVGCWNLFGKDELLGFAGNWLEKKMPHWGKPLGLCPACMASVYGSTVWFATGGDWVWWPAFVLALSGLMVIVGKRLL